MIVIVIVQSPGQDYLAFALMSRGVGGDLYAKSDLLKSLRQ